MHSSSLGLFALTELLLCLSPGPAVCLVLSQALMGGVRRSTWSAFGILGGNLLYFALSATGLGAVLMASYRVFSAVKWAGAAYLVWLGLSTFFSRSPALSVQAARATSPAGFRLMLSGFLMQIANPKAILMFTAFLPQFVDPTAPIAGQMVLMAAISFVIELAVLTVYGCLARQAAAYAARPRYATLSNRVAGSMLLFAAVGMAGIQRS